MGAQWLSGRVLDSRPKGCGFEPHRRHCVVVFEQDTFILALVQPRKTRPCLIERLLMGRKESKQTNKQILLDLPCIPFSDFILNEFVLLNKFWTVKSYVLD